MTPIQKGSDNNGMIEDLEALFDGLESFIPGTLRNNLRSSNAFEEVLCS